MLWYTDSDTYFSTMRRSPKTISSQNFFASTSVQPNVFSENWIRGTKRPTSIRLTVVWKRNGLVRVNRLVTDSNLWTLNKPTQLFCFIFVNYRPYYWCTTTVCPIDLLICSLTKTKSKKSWKDSTFPNFKVLIWNLSLQRNYADLIFTRPKVAKSVRKNAFQLGCP